MACACLSQTVPRGASAARTARSGRRALPRYRNRARRGPPSRASVPVLRNDADNARRVPERKFAEPSLLRLSHATIAYPSRARRESDSSTRPLQSKVFHLGGRGQTFYNSGVIVRQSSTSMNNILNQLIQLQELNFAKEEQKASNSKMPLAQLEKSIAKIRAQLPPEVADRYDRLQKHYPLAVVPLANGSCSRCGLAVPIARGQRRQGRRPIAVLPALRPVPVLPRTPWRASRRRNSRQTAGGGRHRAVLRGEPDGAQAGGDHARRRHRRVGEVARRRRVRRRPRDGDGVGAAPRGDCQHRGGTRPGVPARARRGRRRPDLRRRHEGKGHRIRRDGDHLSKIFFFIVIPTPATAFYLRLLAGLVRTFESTDARKELLDCDEKPELRNHRAKTSTVRRRHPLRTVIRKQSVHVTRCLPSVTRKARTHF